MNIINLLPPGFRDDLSPIAEQEHLYTNKIISIFNSNGYQMTKPPLLEFVNKRDNEKKIFIILDKNKKNKMKIRNDITMQIARISSTRFTSLPRPLRLCYYGEVVRNDVTILRPERQFLQVGAECIGEKNILADIEILTLAFQSLQSVKIKNMSVDFSSPIFLTNIIDKGLINKDDKDEFLKFLQRKDTAKAISFVKKDFTNNIKNLIECSGDLSQKIGILNKLKFNNNSSDEVNNIFNIYKEMKRKFRNIKFNIDFTETRSHDYYSGLNFTIFAKNVRGEIASGGRYLTKAYQGEEATGFTCYMDTIIRASSSNLKQKKIMVPFKTKDSEINKLIDKGFIIERCLNLKKDLTKIARDKICTHALIKNKIVQLF